MHPRRDGARHRDLQRGLGVRDPHADLRALRDALRGELPWRFGLRWIQLRVRPDFHLSI